MGWIVWIVFGLIAGLIAKALLPGKDPGGLIVTIVIGIVGSLLGGWIGVQLGFGDLSGFDLRSMALAVVGAIVLLLLWRLVKKSG